MKASLRTGIVPLVVMVWQTIASQAADAVTRSVDFRYSPPEWQTAICLPDDPYKSLVDRSGELLYHYGRGGREFGTRIAIEVITNALWQKQELYSPRVPIVRTWRDGETVKVLEEAFAVVDVHPPTGTGSPSRNDLILVTVRNTGPNTCTVHPKLIIDTTLPFSFDPEGQRVTVNSHETLTASLKMTGWADKQKSRRTIQLDSLAIAAGQSASFFVVYSGGGSIVVEPTTVEQALADRHRAIEYWEKAPLPFGRVQVPDPGIQALVDSSIRNIWQAREIKNGLPVFQVGPTCYRGLWIVDGAFLLEAAAMVGAGKEAIHNNLNNSEHAV